MVTTKTRRYWNRNPSWVTAVQFDGTREQALKLIRTCDALDTTTIDGEYVLTLYTVEMARRGDWVVFDRDGYPSFMGAKAFAETYEERA